MNEAKKPPHSMKNEAVRVSCQIVGWVTFVTQHRSAGRLSTHVTQHRLMMVLGCQPRGAVGIACQERVLTAALSSGAPTTLPSVSGVGVVIQRLDRQTHAHRLENG